MYSTQLLILFILSLTACHVQETKTSDKIVENETASTQFPTSEKPAKDKQELIERFSDETKIGVARKNKIEISHFAKSEKNFVEIKFYSLDKENKWDLTQTFEFEKYGGLPIDPKLIDFNNDGFKDVTYFSSVAARGANELRKLLIYDKGKNKLIPIENSDEYPNLNYNRELDCLDSWIFYGSTETVFLKIDGIRLKEFASVVDSDTRSVYTINKDGKRKLLKVEKKTKRDGAVRYKNFDPVKTY